MLERALGQLYNHYNDFVMLWNHSMQEMGYRASTPAERQDIEITFHTILSAIGKISKKEDIKSNRELSELCKEELLYFIRTFDDLRKIGAADLSLCYIISTRRAIESIVTDMVLSYDLKIQLISLLSRFTDLIELTAVTNYNTMSRQKEISDLKTANKHLFTEMGIYKEIFDSTSNIVIVIDGEGIVKKINPKAMLFLSEEAVGQHCNILLELSGKNLEELMLEFPPGLSHEIALIKNGIHYVFSFQIKPFDMIPTSTSSGAALILNDITDIADRRETLEMLVQERTNELSESQQMLQSVFQSVGKGILLLDNNDEIIQVNQSACEIFGIYPDILLFKPFSYLLDSESYRKMTEARSSLKTRQSTSIEVLARYIDERTFPAVITIAHMELKGETFWPVIIRDITEQKALENKLIEEKAQSEEINVTLKNVLKTIENERVHHEQQLSQKIKTSLIPGIDKIRNEKNGQIRSGYLDLLKEQLISLTCGTSGELDGNLLKLSKTEIKVCSFIKAGLESKEICEVMNLSFETIQSHRKNIRKKLGLRGRENSLYHYLVNHKFEI